MQDKLDRAFELLELYKDDMVKSLGEAISIPAISPETKGGTGELRKMEYLEELIERLGLKDFAEVQRIDTPIGYTPDPSRPERKSTMIRPNLILRVKGKNSGGSTKWGLAHIDVVPPGEDWDTDPYELVVKDGDMFGRGVEDNGQAVIGFLYSLKAMKDSGIVPEKNVGVILVSDEECGSDFGFKYLLKQDIFREGDTFFVPDAGSLEGDEIEISEKSILWLKISFQGKQSHGSRPEDGINSTAMADEFSSKLRETLYRRFGEKDDLFLPPNSTFETTRVHATSPENTNTIPSLNIREYDFRILPRYNLDDVLSIVNEVRDEIIQKYTNPKLQKKPRIEIEVKLREQAAPPTSPNHEIVQQLKNSITRVYNIDAKCVGIGGGTFAGIVRKAGFPAVVWSKIYETAHQPNERMSIDNMINNAKVYLDFLCS